MTDFTKAENLIKKALTIVKKTGNTEEIARLEQRIEKVRSIKPDIGPVARLAG